MGKRQDDKGQGHEILPGDATMPVLLTARPDVVLRIEDEPTKSPGQGRLKLPYDVRPRRPAHHESMLVDSLHEDQVFGGSQVGKPADSLPDIAMNEGGCDEGAAHRPTWPVLFGRDVSQRRASFQEGLPHGLVVAVDDANRGILLGDLGKPLQPLCVETNARVGQGDPVVSGGGDPHVPTPAGCRVARLHDPEPRVILCDCACQGDGAIVRAPVHQDHLVRQASLPAD